MGQSFVDKLKEKQKNQQELVSAIEAMDTERSRTRWKRVQYFVVFISLVVALIAGFTKMEPIFNFINKHVEMIAKNNKQLEALERTVSVSYMKLNIYLFGTQHSNWTNFLAGVDKMMERIRGHLLRIWTPGLAPDSEQQQAQAGEKERKQFQDLNDKLVGLGNSPGGSGGEKSQANKGAAPEKQAEKELTLLEKLDRTWTVLSNDIEDFWKHRKLGDLVMGPALPPPPGASLGPLNPIIAKGKEAEPNSANAVIWINVTNSFSPPTARQAFLLSELRNVAYTSKKGLLPPTRARVRQLSSNEAARLFPFFPTPKTARPKPGAYRQMQQFPIE